jgi:hypothetical protein
VRAGQNLTAGGQRLAEHIADAVDLRIEAGIRHAIGEPLPRSDILRRQAWPVHTSLVGAEGPKLVQVAEQAFGVDGGHGHLVLRSLD